MWSGSVVRLFVAPEAGAAMQAVEAARAVPERGLEGDRYFNHEGSFSRWPGPHRDLSLIAEEALDEMHREADVRLDPSESRRNVLTRGVPLNDLIGETFSVGEVRVAGIRLCQPCKYLVRLTGKPGLLPHLIGRGGLRVRILDEGFIRVGDVVRPVE